MMNDVKGLKWYCNDCIKTVDSLLLNVDAIKGIERRMTQLELDSNKKIADLSNEVKAQKERIEQMSKLPEEVNAQKLKIEGLGKDIEESQISKEVINDVITERITQIESYAKVAEKNRNNQVTNNTPVAMAATTESTSSNLIIDEDEERKRCIIIHHLEESEDDDVGERIQHDTDETIDICKYLGNDEFGEHNIDKLFRLGTRERGKTRPLKVCLDTMITKYKVIRNTSKFKDSEEYKAISIQHDLTKEQREEIKALVELSKKKEEEDISGNYIYRVRGPPGRKYILKMRKKIEAAVTEVESEAEPE